MKKLNSVAFEEYVVNDGETCLVIFSRKSCHVCQGVHAVLEDLEQDYKGKMPFYEVDVEEESALFEKMMMKGVPQVVIFDNGEQVEKLAGNHEEDDYIVALEKYI